MAKQAQGIAKEEQIVSERQERKPQKHVENLEKWTKKISALCVIEIAEGEKVIFNPTPKQKEGFIGHKWEDGKGSRKNNFFFFAPNSYYLVLIPIFVLDRKEKK